MSIIKWLSQQSPFLKLFYIFLIQLIFVLIMDWLSVHNNYDASRWDTIIWSILLPSGIFFSALIFYHSSPFDGVRRLLAVPLQVVIHTVASWALIVVILLYFHGWIGGTY